MTKLISITILFLFSSLAFSQVNPSNAQVSAISKVIEGYNSHDYRSMKKPWSILGKVFIRKKGLKREFGPYYEKHGAAVIDTITCTSEYECTARLRMEKSPSKRVYLRFIFTGNGKIEGMGFTYPPLIYRKAGSSAAIAPSALERQIDSLMRNKYLLGNKSFNGSVMVLDSGKAIYQKHFGYSDLRSKKELNDSTLYELASCGKQFTAMAILLLQKQGKLMLRDSIQRFIPGLPYRGITIENLLTHTSGLPDYEALLAKVWDKTKFATNHDVVELLKKHNPKALFIPNERFEYSNTGYVLLSVIIEKASGMSYADYLSTEIFRPLNMSHTRVYNTRRSKNEKIDNYAYGYVYDNETKQYVLPDSTKQYQQVVYQDAITGDGTVNSCTQDIIKWENELLNPRLLHRDELERAFTSHKLSNGKSVEYGCGFFLSGGGSCERLIYHTGLWHGYLCIIMRLADMQKTIVVLSNNSYNNFSFIADDIAAILTGD